MPLDASRQQMHASLVLADETTTGKYTAVVEPEIIQHCCVADTLTPCDIKAQSLSGLRGNRLIRELLPPLGDVQDAVTVAPTTHPSTEHPSTQAPSAASAAQHLPNSRPSHTQLCQPSQLLQGCKAAASLKCSVARQARMG
jgi:hypothetical protein